MWLSAVLQPSYFQTACSKPYEHAQTRGALFYHQHSKRTWPGLTNFCGAVTKMAAYHAQFPPHIMSEGHPICHLEALNAVVAIKLWAPSFSNCLLHLFSDNAKAVAIFQAGRGRDCFLQPCAREIWLTCAVWDITLAVGHVPGDSLTGTADALSRYHLGQVYKDMVHLLLSDHDITCTPVPSSLFLLSDDL